MTEKLSRNWQLAIAGWCLSTALGLMGIAVSVSNTGQVTGLRAVSLSLGAGALIFFAAALVRTIMLARRTPLGRVHAGLQIGRHTTRPAASMSDVADAYQFFRSMLRGNSPSLPLMQELFRRQPDTIFLVELHDSDHIKIVGIVIAAPMKKRVTNRFLQKEAVALDADLMKGVARSWNEPHGVYIGGVAGSTRAGKARALTFVEDLIQRSGAEVYIARPVTPDGVRVLKSTGFEPIGEPSPFWALRSPPL